ncbi:hypothetical protein [Streptomyces canus]|uniref:hypothetical protein n=1 Tax=Streptomyces canus TaxID=58343 RepID=UPI0027896103|nr:hypothetical protein [Streptomyces canus]MDQ0762386.1 hypothetical protein [Streptomyces canus]
MGKYAFQPGAECAALTVRPTAEPLLREFLGLLEDMQEELDSQWNGQENSGRRVQRDGSHFRES